jgi:hypothetical protein
LQTWPPGQSELQKHAVPASARAHPGVARRKTTAMSAIHLSELNIAHLSARKNIGTRHLNTFNTIPPLLHQVSDFEYDQVP